MVTKTNTASHTTAQAPWRWVPLVLLAGSAVAFEPIRSGFTLADQSCELTAGLQRVVGGIVNPKHLIGYGLIFVAATFALGRGRLASAAIGTFIFSALLEVEQTYFTTGHCRARDLIPNIIGIALAALLLRMVGFGRRTFRSGRSS